MVETAHAQWKIAKIGEKQSRTAKISTSYRKPMSLNPFSMRYLRLEVELLYLLRMHRPYRRKSRRKRCRALEITASLWEK